MKHVTLACALALMAGCATTGTRAPAGGSTLYVAVAVVAKDGGHITAIDALGAESNETLCNTKLSAALQDVQTPPGVRVDAKCVGIPLPYVPSKPAKTEKPHPAPGEQDL